MNKDQVKGKVSDIAERVEQQTGEWTGDTEAQVSGAAKQVKGKVQKAWGDAEESLKKTSNKEETDRRGEDETPQSEENDLPRDRKAS